METYHVSIFFFIHAHLTLNTVDGMGQVMPRQWPAIIAAVMGAALFSSKAILIGLPSRHQCRQSAIDAHALCAAILCRGGGVVSG